MRWGNEMTKEVKAFSIVSGWYYKAITTEDFAKIRATADNKELRLYDIISPQGDFYADIIEEDCNLSGFMVSVGSAEFFGDLVFCESLLDVLGLYKTLGFVEKRGLVECGYCTFFNANIGECRLNPPVLTTNGFYNYPRTEKKWSCSLGQYTRL